MNAHSFLAIARIARKMPKKDCYRITTGGDILQTLENGCKLSLYLPRKEEPMLSPAVDGIFDESLLTQVTLLDKSVSRGAGWVQIKLEVPMSDATGCWLLIEKSRIPRNKGDIYFFELKSLPVFDAHDNGREIGKVSDYFETGAHGVIEIILNDGDKILLPFTEPHTVAVYEKNLLVKLIAPDYADFMSQNVSE